MVTENFNIEGYSTVTNKEGFSCRKSRVITKNVSE